MSAISKGKIKLNVTDVDLVKLVDEVFEQQLPTAHAQGLTLGYCEGTDKVGKTINERAKPASGEFIIQADALRLYQILSNLVYNGIKYTESGGVYVSIEYTYINQVRHVELKVHDTGIGIETKDFPALFDQFQPINHKINKPVESTGLGLPIALELITRLQGSISVSSTYGLGSIFTVTLPTNQVK